jgi:predicted transcriptional regulator of viral defense system
MVTGQPTVQDWLRLIRGEFEELPDLQLTQRQVEELWGLESAVAEALLGALVSAGFLTRTRHGTYVRGDAR